MTFVAMDELKKRFPNHEIYLLSEMDKRRPEEEKEQYSFQFTGWYPVKFARAQQNPVLRMTCLLRNHAEFTECEQLYRNCDLMVDISGYGLGSNWGVNQLANYLDHLEFAKAYNIPCYLMPQSFGPFDFQGEKKAQGDRVADLLSSAKLICAREQEGYDLLKETYHLQNLALLPDLVLSNREIDIKNIFTAPPEMNLPEIEEHSVAVIPNGKIAELMDQDSFLALYQAVISFLLEKDKTVYLLTHATSDNLLCEIIKAIFPKEDKVVLLDQDFSCLEYNALVGRFEFLIASRFHSIVHAFKNAVPCVALGWAVKYSVLMESFSQSGYCIDLRKQTELPSIISIVNQLCDRFSEESIVIRNALQKAQEQNAFDFIEL